MTELETENQQLKARIRALEAELKFLKTHTLLQKGISGETIVAELIGGDLTSYAAGHDVRARDGARLEVKYSAHGPVTKLSEVRRWQWNKLLGESGQKDFDYLVLVGDVDERYRETYLCPSQPYVIFLLSRDELIADFGAPRALTPTTNPLGRIRGPTELLFRRFQVSAADLAQMFGW